MTKQNTKDQREIVIPGEIVSEEKNMLPGEWTLKQGDQIIATRLGVCEKSERLVKIIPISGVYIPRRGNIVIGVIRDITMHGWVVDIKGPYSSFLPLKECSKFIPEYEMENVYQIGDLVLAKINNVVRSSVDLTVKGRGLGKINEGILIEINPHRVPRVIGREGSMVKVIKDNTNCKITVGQNGLIWIHGDNIQEELFAKRAIEYINENTLSEGLTERTESWFKDQKKEK